MKKLNHSFIRSRRTDLKITLQEMAETLDFKNASTYMKYEKDEYSFRAEHLPVIANKLNCNIQDLFFEGDFAESAKSKRNTA